MSNHGGCYRRTYGESLAWVGNTGNFGELTDWVDGLYRSLFVDEGIAGRGHRLNLLNENFRGSGVGILGGSFEQYNAVITLAGMNERLDWILWRPMVRALCIWLLVPSTAAALVGGELDVADRYGAVVALRTGADGLCSATKIGPRSLLTAAHCMVDLETGSIKAVLASGNRRIVIQSATGHDASAQSLQIAVERVRLASAYQQALSRFVAYKRTRIAALAGGKPGLGPESGMIPLEQGLRIRHHFSARFPDVAIVQLQDETPSIPTLEIDFEPVPAGVDVVLVGYGCGRRADGSVRPVGTRAWGRTQVIRVDAVNLYSKASQMTEGAPSLCPGDSGGPVLRNGRVVGVLGVVYGLNWRHGARSNMAAQLSGLAHWDAWP